MIQTFFLISWFSLLLLQLLRHLFYRHLKLHRQRYILIVLRLILVMVVFFIAFRLIHLSTPLIRLFLLVLILLFMPTLNFLPVWFALSLLRFRLPSRLPMMFILWIVAMMVVIIPSRTVCVLTSFPVRRAIMFVLVSWFGLTLPLLNAADWFRGIRLLKRLFVSSHLSEVIYVWCYCWRYCFCSCWWRHVYIVWRRSISRLRWPSRCCACYR